MRSALSPLLILVLAFLLMMIINESQRKSIDLHDHKIYGAITMNSADEYKNKCTWACHNNSNHCKNNHATFISQYSEIMDPIYFGMIKGLKSTGDYGLANIILLALAWPLLMCYLIIRIFQLRKQLYHDKSI